MEKTKTKSIGASCKHDPSMVCFYLKECKFLTVTECLRQNLYLAQKEIALLKQRRNIKHTRMSVKWRDTAFYYKKKAVFLQHYIHEKGIPLPNVRDMYPQSKLSQRDAMIIGDGGSRGSGGDDERVGSSKEDNLDVGDRTNRGSTE